MVKATNTGLYTVDIQCCLPWMPMKWKSLNIRLFQIIKIRTITYYIKHFLWDWFHFLLKCTILSYFWNKKYISKRNAYFSLESVYVNFHIKFCDKPRLQKVGNSFSQRWEYFTYVEISFSFISASWEIELMK